MKNAHVSIGAWTTGDLPGAKALCAKRPMWAALLTDPDLTRATRSLLAARSAQGALMGALWLETAGDWCDVVDVIVDPQRRRQGVGRRLLQAAIDVARHLDRLGVTLEVAVDNDAAIALYRSLGFAVIDRRHHYYRNEKGHKDALVMSYRCKR